MDPRISNPGLQLVKKQVPEKLPEKLPTLFELLEINEQFIDMEAWKFGTEYSSELIITIKEILEKITKQHNSTPEIGDMNKISQMIDVLTHDAKTRLKDPIYFAQTSFGILYLKKVMEKMHTRIKDFEGQFLGTSFESVSAMKSEFDRLARWKDNVQSQEQILRGKVLKNISSVAEDQVKTYLATTLG